MALDQNHVNRILGAARARDVSKVEELWIDLQSRDGAIDELKVFLSIATEVANRGDKEKAAELLLLLRQDLKEAGRDDDLFMVLRMAIDYSHRVKGVRDDLVEVYRKKYGDRPGLEAVISRIDLAGEGRVDEAVRQLDEAFFFQVGDYVFHARGWGVGRVVESYPESGEFVIDFSRRRGQRMEAGMALKALERRGPEDLDVLLWTDKDAVRDLAKNDPLGLLRKALINNNGKLQSRVLREKLSDVLEKTAWTRFWSKARKKAKDDPTIELGSGPRATITIREQPLSREEEVAGRITRLHGFKDRLGIVRSEVVSMRKDAAGSPPPVWVPISLEALKKNHGKIGSPAQRAARIEYALYQTEVAEVWPESVPDIQLSTDEPEIDPDTGEPLPPATPEHLQSVLTGLVGDKLPPVLAEVSIAEYRKKVVRLISAIDPATAPETLEAVLLDPAPQTWEAAVTALKAISRDDVILQAATKVLIKPENYPEAMAAIARARLSKSVEMLKERSDAEILVKAMQVFDTISLEFKGTSNRRLKARLKSTVETLRGLVGEKNQRVIGRVVEEGTEAEVRRVLQLVRQSPNLTPTIKRATEKFVAKRFPELLATVATTQRGTAEEEALYSTSEGRRRREQELSDILNVKMEQIRIEIGKALEFGDISENAELDAARETQQRLADQAKLIQEELERVTIIDAAQIDTEQVEVGTRVSVENLDTEADEAYSILGPWDLTDTDDTIISYRSALGTGLRGNKVGEEVTVELPGGGTARYRVKSIENALQGQSAG